MAKDIDDALLACIERSSDTFYAYLSQLKDAKQRGFSSSELEQYYEQNPHIQPIDHNELSNMLGEDIHITSLGGNYNPVYKVIFEGNDYIIKVNNQAIPSSPPGNNQVYIDARNTLLNDKKTRHTLVGGDVRQITTNPDSGAPIEVWPVMTGGDLLHRSKLFSDDLGGALHQRDALQVLEGMFAQLHIMEKNGTYQTDLKAENIYFADNDLNSTPLFADDKGWTNVSNAASVNELDYSPGYVPPEAQQDKTPLSIKALNLYQLAISMENYLLGKPLSDRALPGGDLTADQWDIYRNDELYRPDPSSIDQSTSEGQALHMLLVHMEQCQKSDEVDFEALEHLTQNTQHILAEEPELITYLNDQITKDTPQAKEMITILSEKPNKKSLNRLHDIKEQDKTSHIQDKYDDIQKSIDIFNSIESQLKSLPTDSDKSPEQKEALAMVLKQSLNQIASDVKTLHSEINSLLADIPEQEALSLFTDKNLAEIPIQVKEVELKAEKANNAPSSTPRYEDKHHLTQRQHSTLNQENIDTLVQKGDHLSISQDKSMSEGKTAPVIASHRDGSSTLPHPDTLKISTHREEKATDAKAPDSPKIGSHRDASANDDHDPPKMNKSS